MPISRQFICIPNRTSTNISLSLDIESPNLAYFRMKSEQSFKYLAALQREILEHAFKEKFTKKIVEIIIIISRKLSHQTGCVHAVVILETD